MSQSIQHLTGPRTILEAPGVVETCSTPNTPDVVNNITRGDFSRHPSSDLPRTCCHHWQPNTDNINKINQLPPIISLCQICNGAHDDQMDLGTSVDTIQNSELNANGWFLGPHQSGVNGNIAHPFQCWPFPSRVWLPFGETCSRSTFCCDGFQLLFLADFLERLEPGGCQLTFLTDLFPNSKAEGHETKSFFWGNCPISRTRKPKKQNALTPPTKYVPTLFSLELRIPEWTGP